MLKVSNKGDITLAAPAWGILITGVCLFGGWMTKMHLDVSKVYDIEEKVTKIETALFRAGLIAEKDEPWPVPAPYSPRYFVSPASSSPAVVTKRESGSGTSSR